MKNLRPKGGLLNLPAFSWNSIYTTNYDELVEKAFLRAKKELRVVVSNFDFGGDTSPTAVELFKIHGTLGRDVSEGDVSRMVLTESDNDEVEEFREFLYDRLRSDKNQADLLVIGHSLNDPDLRSAVDRAIALKRKISSPRQIYLLLHQDNPERTELYEARGIRVCIASIDRFFLELEKNAPQNQLVASSSDLPLTETSVLNTTCRDVGAAIVDQISDFSKVFSGSPPSYGDISAGFTFERELTQTVINDLSNGKNFAMIVGVGGVGKTTVARQAIMHLSLSGWHAWEHTVDTPFLPEEWAGVAARMQANEQVGCLMVDEANVHLPEINLLAERLAAEKISSLKLLLVSARNHWRPRVKSPELFRHGKVYELAKLSPIEIDRLLNFVDSNAVVKRLVEKSFGGYSKREKKRRLIERCSRDFFVCLKNIFASDSFDEIVLREFADVNEGYRNTYKYLCALESFGVRVHRQLVVRLLGITAQDIGLVLANLDGLIEEYEISEQGVCLVGGDVTP